MPSTAIAANGTIVQIATGTGGAKTITGIALGNPTIITSAAHGLLAGDVVALAAIVGTTQLNGVTAVVAYKTTNTLALPIDSTAYTPYTSGGTATPQTFTTLGNAKTFNGLDGSPAEIDVTNFASTFKEFIMGLTDGGALSIDLDLDNNDAGQVAARAKYGSKQLVAFKVILPSGTTPTATFNAYVKKFSVQGQVDATVKGSIDLRLSSAVTWS